MKELLIVDDSIVLLQELGGLIRPLVKELKKGEVQIHTATSAGEAMGIISYTHIDILITDFSMPDLNGLELIAALRGRPEIRKVLMTFSQAEIEDHVRVAEDEIDAVLFKPFDRNRLKDLLNRSL
jgi:CheY-like chemotaxis protein